MSREMTLSKRMQSVADCVSRGVRLADVGCDHGYLSIWLCETGKIPSAIAMDVNEGPLKRAEANVSAHHLQDRIQLRLSDGLTKLAPGEVDSVVIAGMGGMLMCRILVARPDVTALLQEMILEPQSDVDKVRSYIERCGFCITEEDMVLEDGKYYPVIRAVPIEPGTTRRVEETTPDSSASSDCAVNMENDADVVAEQPGKSQNQDEMQNPEEKLQYLAHLRYGKFLLEKKHPVLRNMLDRDRKKAVELLEHLSQSTTEKGLARAAELREELQCISAALKYYEM